MHTTIDPQTAVQDLARKIKTTEEIREEQSKPRQVGDMKHGLTGSRPQMSILPRTGLVYGGRAIEYGADKYARGNYHGPPPAKLGANAGAKRLLGYIDAAMRHLTHTADAINRALGTGGDVAAACAVVDDEASGNFPPSMLPHLSHALASLLIGVSCGMDDKLLPADPGQPWRAAELGLPQKDNPAAERARVEALAKPDPETFQKASGVAMADALVELARKRGDTRTRHEILEAAAPRYEIELEHARKRAESGNRNAMPVFADAVARLDREIAEDFGDKEPRK